MVTYNMHYKLFTKTLYPTKHIACKNDNYLFTLENDMILGPIYS